jgi:DNA-binding XRE family transcriptional regulator
MKTHRHFKFIISNSQGSIQVQGESDLDITCLKSVLLVLRRSLKFLINLNTEKTRVQDVLPLIEFGCRIKQARITRKITQQKLAELTGIERTHLSRIENGQIYPQPNTAYKIEQALKTPLMNQIYHFHLSELRVVEELLITDPQNAHFS